MTIEVGIRRANTIKGVIGLTLAMLVVVALAAPALAQSANDQYAVPTSPAGPAAQAQCTVAGDTIGVVNAGDVITCAGDFDISEGSSVVLQDSDGTQGTFVDGVNAEITEGSIIIAVTAEPINVAGGNGVLNTEGLFVVATTGVSAATTSSGAAAAVGGGAAGGGTAAVTGLLPETGGLALLGVISAVMLTAGGIVGLRSRFSRER